MNTKRNSLPVSAIAFAILAVSIRSASATPPGVYNKGIHIEYTVTSTILGERGARNVVSKIKRTIYVSSAGRLFERVVWSNQFGRIDSDNSPNASTNRGGEARGMSFHGNTLVAHIGYASGAGQMTIHFDPAFSGCEGTVNFGTESGKAMARRGVGGSLRQITSIKASGVSCTVSMGNPFQ